MKIIAGLGNPGEKYEKTRHNVGFRTIDFISEKQNIKVDRIKFKALIGEGFLGGEKIILVKPQTFMNLSGESIVEISRFYKIEMEDLYVIYDDIDVELGKLRIRKKGSSGSHNGMKNIIYHLQSDEFPRFRIGISSPPPGENLINYVMSPFSKTEYDLLNDVIKQCAEAIETSIEENFDIAMNRYNKR